MSFVYSSNSPEFLNYIAHTKTRNDIVNDPKLCVLLEDPHIKDNMELALLYRAAQYGNYEAKKEFIGFFLANGPELDTDTIMYFREKILHNSTYMEIYKSEYYNISIIDNPKTVGLVINVISITMIVTGKASANAIIITA